MTRSPRASSLALALALPLALCTSCKNNPGEEAANTLPKSPPCSRCFDGQRCVQGSCVGVGRMSVTQLHQGLPGKPFKLINVLDFDAGTIPGTSAQIPYNDMDNLVKFLGPDRRQLVVLYCRSIPKARMASQKLDARGYTNVVTVTGGIRAWTKAGYPLQGAQK